MHTRANVRASAEREVSVTWKTLLLLWLEARGIKTRGIGEEVWTPVQGIGADDDGCPPRDVIRSQLDRERRAPGEGVDWRVQTQRLFPDL